jgi:hypothetical protein
MDITLYKCILLQTWAGDDVFLDLDTERGLKAGDRSALKQAAECYELVIFVVSPCGS